MASNRGYPDEFRREFVCDVQAVGDGVATLKYLSRYVFRTAITNNRIVGLHNDQVTFTYRRHGEQRGGKPRERRMTLPVLEFLRRFLQHVLPRGLHKVRHYGFLSRRSAIDLEDVRAAIADAQCVAEADVELQQLPAPWPSPVLSRPAAEASGPTCPHCGGRLVFEQFLRVRPPPQFARSLSPPLRSRFAPSPSSFRR